jgi:hypothetical protein
LPLLLQGISSKLSPGGECRLTEIAAVPADPTSFAAAWTSSSYLELLAFLLRTPRLRSAK